MMDKFEYKIINDGCGGSPDGEDELNMLGSEGWELVAITQEQLGNSKWYFKRRVQS